MDVNFNFYKVLRTLFACGGRLNISKEVVDIYQKFNATIAKSKRREPLEHRSCPHRTTLSE